MELIRLSVTKDTLLPKVHLATAELPDTVTSLWACDTIQATLPQRNATDTLRVALAYHAHIWQKFTRLLADGTLQECKVIIDSPKNSDKAIDYRIRVRRRDSKNVSYSDEVATIQSGTGGVVAVTDVTAEGRQLYPDLVASLCDISDLLSFGEQHWFANDVRRMAQDLLRQDVLPLWPGTFLALSGTATVTLDALRILLSKTSHGSATLRILSLDNTPANREALARELGEKWSEEVQEITDMLGFTDPNVKRCQRLFDALIAKVKQAEELLGIEIPIWDGLADLELSLSMLSLD